MAAFALIILTGCAESATLDELADGQCSSNQSRIIQEHISGQIQAFSEQEWELAYSFASTSFRETVPLEQFIVVIGTQYQMLIENESFEFGPCVIASEIIRQQVNVISQSENFALSYDLSYLANKLGIESAIVSLEEVQVNI